MVFVNGKKILIYNLDTEQTIIERIASKLNTLPQFLFFINGIPTLKEFHNEELQVQVEDLFKLIKDNSFNENFKEFYDKIKDKLQNKNLSIEDIVDVYITYNKSLQELQDSVDSDYMRDYMFFYLDTIKTQIKSITGIDVDVKKITINCKNNLIKFNKLIDENIKRSEEKENEFSSFENIKGIPYEPFELEKIMFEMTLDIKDLSLLELFNIIKLNDNVPFATCNYFYKIRKEFVPPLSWELSSESSIILKVMQKENVTYNIQDYADILIEKDVENNNFKVLLNYSAANNIPKEQIISRFVDILETSNNSLIKNVIEKQINGVFYFPNQRLNKYIISDLIMNKNIFRDYLSIDETSISQKPTVFIRFYTAETDDITAFLTEKIVDKKDQDVKLKPNFMDNSYYVRVKISSVNNIKSINKFQDILSKLFVKYNYFYSSILDFYTKFIPLEEIERSKPVKKIKQKKSGKDTNLRNVLAPEIFVSNYTRFCGEPPTLINDEDEATMIAQGKQVLTFPKDTSEGSIPRKYICEYKHYPYPGLRENTLNNSDKFKYLLCCFESDQTKKPEYRNYYFGDEVEDTESFTQHIITTNKLLNNGQIGHLPHNIKKFFDIIDEDKNYEYYRIGMTKGNNSFINCVLFALNSGEYDNENLNTIRKSLSTLELSASCRQEMFDFTSQEIINKINNLEEYFNPNFFIHLLEIKYNCNIFLFNRNEENIDGSLSIPRHIKGYFKYKKPFNKTIFIYENKGIDSDNTKYPYCELIFRWNKKGKKDDLQYNFNSDFYVSKNAFTIFNEYNDFYIIKNRFFYNDFILSDKVKVLSQTIDFYGKTRMINIEYNTIKLSIFTSPIQPLNAIEETEYNVYKLENTNIKEILGILGIENNSIKNENIHAQIGNVDVKIPLNTSNLKSVSEFKSVINDYNKYKKLSRYIVQYLFWLYSKYLNESNKIPSIDNFEDFVAKNIMINEKIEYSSNIGKNFSLDCPLLLNKKLVLKSNESLKRSLYSLRFETMQNPEKIVLYYNRISIEHYYLDISDFDIYSFQFILKGSDSISKFLKSSLQDEIQYKIYNKILKESTNPYFFKNNLVSDTVYLAQNTTSVKNAIKIYYNWVNKNYNPLFELDEISSIEIGFLFFSYKNSLNIKSYFVNGERSNPKIKIIGYKITKEDKDEDEIQEDFQEKSFYTILLPLN